MRNALNALLVNLEVVRSRARGGRIGRKLHPPEQCAQSEEAARLAEGSIALLESPGWARSATRRAYAEPERRSPAERIERRYGRAQCAVRALERLWRVVPAFGRKRRLRAVILSIPEGKST